jgi:hypothetical protein
MSKSQTKIATILLTIFVTILILVLRKPEAFFNAQFWAEDGPIFFKESHQFGLESLLMRARGYYRTDGRIIALLVNCFPTYYAPLLYNLSALLITIFVFLFIFSPNLSLPLKPLIVMAIVLIPIQNEVYVNLTNVIWIHALAILLFSLTKESKIPKRIFAESVTVFFLGLSGPFTFLLSLAFTLRLFVKRSLHSLLLLLACISSALLQLPGLEATRIETTKIPPLIDYFRAVSHFIGPLFLGHWGNPTVYNTKLPYLITLCGVFIFYFLGKEAWKRKDLIPINFLISGLTILVAGIFAFRKDPDRYFFIPSVLLIWTAIYFFKATKRNIIGFLIGLIFAVPIISGPGFKQVTNLFFPNQWLFIFSLSTLLIIVLALRKKSEELMVLSLIGSLTIVGVLGSFYFFPKMFPWEGYLYYLAPSAALGIIILYCCKYKELTPPLLLSFFLASLLVNHARLQSKPVTDYNWKSSANCIDKNPPCKVLHPPDGWHFVYRK